MQLVERTLDALSILSKEPGGLSVTELSDKMRIPPSSAHRILSCLKKQHFVSQNADNRKYQIGYKLLTLSSNINKENVFTRTAKPFMRELADKINKTVTLCTMEGDNVVCLDYIENQDTSLFLVRTGFAMPPHATSTGKVMQAYMPPERVRRIYQKHVSHQLTVYTNTSLHDFVKELEEIRKNGYAICDEELQLGVQGIACPIFDSTGRIAGSVAFTALKSDNAINPHSISLLKHCAERISINLGDLRKNKTL